MSQEILSGKTALITGAGKRIGRSIALALADERVNIVIHYPKEIEETKELSDRLTERKVKWWLIKADFANLQETETLIRRTADMAGPFDFLINNASIFSRNTLMDMTFENIVQQMQVNAWSPFNLSREFVRIMGKGKIINLLDTKIYSYDWDHTAYILSKNMLLLLTKMTAVSFAPKVSVNGIAPGLILPPAGKDEHFLEKLAETVPLKKHGNPSDIAQAVIYLLKSTYLTGQIISVDGGKHLNG